MPVTSSSSTGQLHIVDRPGNAPAFVMMHGFPDDHHIYDHLAPLLAPRRVVTFDFSGYGESARVEPKAPSDDLAAVIDGLGLAQVVLVGHDASGPVAIDYALDHPDRVGALALLNTFYGRAAALRFPEMIRLFADPDFAPLADAMINDPTQLLWLLQYQSRHFFGTGDVVPDGIAAVSILPQFFATTDRPDALAAIRAWTATLFTDLDDQDKRVASGELARLAMPVELIIGANDVYLGPSLAGEIAAHFASATVSVVRDASHWPQWDRPELVARSLLDSGA